MEKYSTENDDTNNKIIQPITALLYKLRDIEHSTLSISKKYSRAKPIFKKVLAKLCKHKDFLLHRKLWEELHDRQAFYYEYQNRTTRKSKIPFFRVVLHNKIVPEWLSVKNKLRGPLLHFDTHDDMDVVENVRDKHLTKTVVDKGACGYINHPVTCLVWSQCIDSVVWCMPKWVYDTPQCYTQALTISGHDMIYIRGEQNPHDEFLYSDTVEIVDEQYLDPKHYDFFHEISFCRARTNTTKQLERLSAHIEDKYILDIDLDYFCCQGEKLSRQEYIEDFGDIQSSGRIDVVPTAHPRGWISVEQKTCIKNLKQESKTIVKRINKFIDCLRFLKKQGKTPSVINISDSTGAFMSGNHDRAVITNGYCPKYFVPFINDILVAKIQHLFN